MNLFADQNITNSYGTLIPDFDWLIGVLNGRSDFENAQGKCFETMLSLTPQLNRNRDALIVSAGSGTSATLLAKKSQCSVTLLTLNQKKVGDQLAANVVALSLDKLSGLKEKHFDCVWIIDCLNVVGMDKLKDFYRVLRPGGQLLISELANKDPDSNMGLPNFSQIKRKAYEQGFHEYLFQDLSRFIEPYLDELKQRIPQHQKDDHISLCRAIDSLKPSLSKGNLQWGIIRFTRSDRM